MVAACLCGNNRLNVRCTAPQNGDRHKTVVVGTSRNIPHSVPHAASRELVPASAMRSLLPLASTCRFGCAHASAFQISTAKFHVSHGVLLLCAAGGVCRMRATALQRDVWWQKAPSSDLKSVRTSLHAARLARLARHLHDTLSPPHHWTTRSGAPGSTCRSLANPGEVHALDAAQRLHLCRRRH
jgi:hypothetical protein